jgi:vanillate/4-hydroxybenzoate decarboxylase subunit D
MICARCKSQHTRKIAASPVAGAWEVRVCERCLFSWRTTEPDHIVEPDSYPSTFALTEAEIDAARDVPNIPPRRV